MAYVFFDRYDTVLRLVGGDKTRVLEEITRTIKAKTHIPPVYAQKTIDRLIKLDGRCYDDLVASAESK